jgi:outer membrane immunogenic protein
MVRFTWALCLLLGMATTLTARAADLPSKTAEPEFEEPPPIPVFSWTGFYAGLHAGGAIGHDAGHIDTPAGGRGGFASGSFGIIGGAHAGYNYELAQTIANHPLVVGLEADIDGADLRSRTLAYDNILPTSSDLKGSIRGRLGVADSRVLYFATGGLALADLETRDIALPGAGTPSVGTADRTVAGYTLGAGVEYAFTNSYALRAEYRTSHYGATGSSALPAPGLGAPVAVVHRDSDNRLQAGISYRFPTPLPSDATSAD